MQSEQVLKENVPLHKNPDGSVSFFWIDAHEDIATPGQIYLFGKVWSPQTKKYSSCTVIVRNLKRVMYAFPKISPNEPIDDTYVVYLCVCFLKFLERETWKDLFRIGRNEKQ